MVSERKREAFKGVYRALFKDFYDEMRTKRLHPGKTAYGISAEAMDELCRAAKKECWKEFD